MLEDIDIWVDGIDEREEEEWEELDKMLHHLHLQSVANNSQDGQNFAVLNSIGLTGVLIDFEQEEQVTTRIQECMKECFSRDIVYIDLK